MLVAVVAALIAAGAFVLALSYSSKGGTGGSPNGSAPTAKPAPSTVVVVASSAIAKGQPLSAANLTTESFPDSVLHSLTVAGISDYSTVTQLTGSRNYAAADIPAGIPILSSMVASTASIGPTSGLPAQLPSGYVAMSLPYAPGATSGNGEGTGGYIATGERIDILVYLPTSEYWAYQDVLVLAVGESAGAPAGSPSASASPGATAPTPALIMVELPRQDAAALDEAKATAGSVIQYVIVSSSDYPGPTSSPVPGATAPPQTVPGSGPTNFFGG